MARPKKSEKEKGELRATNIRAKSGMLYIIRASNSIRNGKKVWKYEWVNTNLRDTKKNLEKAKKMRDRMNENNDELSIDRKVSVSEYIDLFLDKKKRVIANTTYASYLNRAIRIKDYFGDFKLCRIKSEDVEKFLDSLFLDRSMQKRTVKDIKSFFGNVMKDAVKSGLLAYNPVEIAVISKPLADKNAKAKNPDDDFFSYQDANRFLELLKGDNFYDVYYIALHFGLRREEVLGLRWSAVDLNRKTIVIDHTITKGTQVNRQNTTKTKASLREYPLTDEQVDMFKARKKAEDEDRGIWRNGYLENNYVFTNELGEPFYPDSLTRHFTNFIKKHPELPQGVRLKGLRTSCISILVHEGKDIKSIQEWVGHADINTTLRYYAKVKAKEAKNEIASVMSELIPYTNSDKENK